MVRVSSRDDASAPQPAGAICPLTIDGDLPISVFPMRCQGHAASVTRLLRGLAPHRMYHNHAGVQRPSVTGWRLET
jgi:hypothetical protein